MSGNVHLNRSPSKILGSQADDTGEEIHLLYLAALVR